jgi:hypothetical protein
MAEQGAMIEMVAETQAGAMDLPSSPAGTSDASSDDGSTRPTTPSSSPLFCASRMEDLTLSHFTHFPGSATLQSFPAWGQVKNICVVGAGYVGMLVLFCFSGAKSHCYRWANCSRYGAAQPVDISRSLGPRPGSHSAVELTTPSCT